VHLAFDIFQGLGIAAAVGIRPFIPALVVGGLASAGFQIHFSGTDYSFLQGTPFLLAVVIGAIAASVAERQLGPDASDSGPFPAAMVAIGVVLAALLFAGALVQHHSAAAWPGWLGGAVCALLGAAATRPLLKRVRARLDDQAASATTLYAEGTALVVAFLSVVAPPVGLVTVAALLWLLLAGRRREGEKYAGLRILR
jgi:Domain of unknown function (DUF4126)